MQHRDENVVIDIKLLKKVSCSKQVLDLSKELSVYKPTLL